MSPVRLVVFDLDGTLIDSCEDLTAAVNATLACVAPGTRALPASRVRALIGSGARNLVLRSLAEAGVVRPVEDVLPAFLKTYRRGLLERTRLYPGVEEALDRLGDRTLAVLSNKPGDMSRAILEGLGVAGRFARIYGGDDLPGKKPDPAGLLRLMEEMGTRPAEVAIVGDSAIDVRTGRAAGVRTIGVTYGFDPGSFEADPPDLLVDDLRELPKKLSLPASASVLP